jgi:hypothetical protein
MKSLILKIFLGFTLIGFALSVEGQSRNIDSTAISILDRMSLLIGSLNSVSVKINTNYDIRNKALGLVKHSNVHELFLHGPDKLFLASAGDKGSRHFYYNGKSLTYYSDENNQYAEIKAPENLIGMIDSIHNQYGIEFPGADFFYPKFVEDLITESTTLKYLGTTLVDGKESFHIAGMTKDKSFQFWIAKEVYYLPLKLVIVYTQKDLNPQFESLFTDWKINPSIPDALFEFSAPPNAHKIKLIAHKPL